MCAITMVSFDFVELVVSCWNRYLIMVMKDYLSLLLPKYEIFVDETKVQEDNKVFAPGREENDQSCSCLALYNLRDMWYRRSGSLPI